MAYFDHTSFLLLLLALPLLWPFYRWLKRKRLKNLQALGDPKLVSLLIREGSGSNLNIKIGTFVLLIVLGSFALADLKSPSSDDPISRKGVDVIIALDVSKSMLATDARPNRLEMARQFIYRLLEQMPDNRIGLVVFAGHAYLQMPLTVDHGAAQLYLQQLSTDMVPTQGTVIGEALQICQNAFNSREAKNKAIVLITDGEDHDPEALELAKSLKNNGIMVNTVGIGSVEGTQLMNPNSNAVKLDKEGHPVVSKLNEDLLRQLAARTEGGYLHLTNPNTQSESILKKIDNIEKTSLVDNTYRSFKHYYLWFLIPMLLIYLAGSVNFNPFKSAFKVTASSAKSFLFGLVFIPLFALSQSKQQQLVYEGNLLYLEKKLDQALIQYSQCLQQDPNNITARFNLGVTYFRLQQLESAERIFTETALRAKEPYLKQKALYNKGVVLTQLHKLPESINAYKEALKLNPKDQDARFNLEKALESA